MSLHRPLRPGPADLRDCPTSESLFLGRDPHGSVIDQVDRQRIREQLMHLGLALR